ncbi:MAG: hypothetical protein WCO79_01710 [bacterium]
MEISRELAITILNYLDTHKSWYFPFRVMGRVGADGHIHTFFLQENLQHLDTDTTRLLAKGFIEKITGESLEEYIAVAGQGVSRVLERGFVGERG